MTVYGWDLSNHDWDRHSVDLADAKRAGISLVTHKATEGNWYRDPYLDDYAAQLGRVSFPVAGTYHVLNHGIGVAEQTDYWISYVNAKWPDWRRHPCPIWQIDAEPLDSYRAPTKAEIVACGQRLVSKLGIAPTQVVVYDPRWVYGDSLTGQPFHMWASSYVTGSGGFKSLYPGDDDERWGKYSGQTPLIVQYSSSAVIGAQHTCDANAIRVSTPAQLQALFRSTTPPPAPPARQRRRTMLVYRIDPATVPKNVNASGWFTFNGSDVRHVDSPAGPAGHETNNGTALLHALGQAEVATVTYQQHADWKAGK